MGNEEEQRSNSPAFAGFAKAGDAPEPVVPEVVYRSGCYFYHRLKSGSRVKHPAALAPRDALRRNLCHATLRAVRLSCGGTTARRPPNPCCWDARGWCST